MEKKYICVILQKGDDYLEYHASKSREESYEALVEDMNVSQSMGFKVIKTVETDDRVEYHLARLEGYILELYSVNTYVNSFKEILEEGDNKLTRVAFDLAMDNKISLVRKVGKLASRILREDATVKLSPIAEACADYIYHERVISDSIARIESKIDEIPTTIG